MWPLHVLYEDHRVLVYRLAPKYKTGSNCHTIKRMLGKGNLVGICSNGLHLFRTFCLAIDAIVPSVICAAGDADVEDDRGEVRLGSMYKVI